MLQLQQNRSPGRKSPSLGSQLRTGGRPGMIDVGEILPNDKQGLVYFKKVESRGTINNHFLDNIKLIHQARQISAQPASELAGNPYSQTYGQ